MNLTCRLLDVVTYVRRVNLRRRSAGADVAAVAPAPLSCPLGTRAPRRARADAAPAQLLAAVLGPVRRCRASGAGWMDRDLSELEELCGREPLPRPNDLLWNDTVVVDGVISRSWPRLGERGRLAPAGRRTTEQRGRRRCPLAGPEWSLLHVFVNTPVHRAGQRDGARWSWCGCCSIRRGRSAAAHSALDRHDLTTRTPRRAPRAPPDPADLLGAAWALPACAGAGRVLRHCHHVNASAASERLIVGTEHPMLDRARRRRRGSILGRGSAGAPLFLTPRPGALGFCQLFDGPTRAPRAALIGIGDAGDVMLFVLMRHSRSG